MYYERRFFVGLWFYNQLDYLTEFEKKYAKSKKVEKTFIVY